MQVAGVLWTLREAVDGSQRSHNALQRSGRATTFLRKSAHVERYRCDHGAGWLAKFSGC